MLRRSRLVGPVALGLTLLPACGGDPGHEEAGRQAHAQGGDNLSESYGLLPAVRIEGDRFVDEKGQTQPIKGFSWFGFNTGTGAPDGLWGNDPIGNDFERAVRRQKLLGFNAVRLPFSFAEFPKEPRKFAIGCSDVSDEDVAKATLMPEKNGDLAQAPKLAWPAKREAGQCNGYLPTTTTRERYIWTVLFYVRNNFYVLVDNHYREDQTAENDEKAWVQGWADLAHDLLVKHPETQGRVFFDLLNEPGQYGQAWEKGQKAGIHHLYLAAMDAIWAQSDKALFGLEGTGQDSLGANWGDGYCTDPSKIQQHGLSDPRPFFTELATKPYKASTFLAPHVYGPAVTHAPKDFSGQGLIDRLDASFGTLTKAGFAAPGGPLTLPIAIGEFGSKFQEQGDVEFMRDFAKYLKDGGPNHNPIEHWYYWDWNADSGDTGGLVADNWKDIEWVKVAYLVESLGLRPWWDSSAPAVVSPHTAQSTAEPTAAPASPPAPSPSSASTAGAGTQAPSSTAEPAKSPAAATGAPPAPTKPEPTPTGASAVAETKTPSPATVPASAAGAPVPPPAPASTPAKSEPDVPPSMPPLPELPLDGSTPTQFTAPPPMDLPPTDLKAELKPQAPSPSSTAVPEAPATPTPPTPAPEQKTPPTPVGSSEKGESEAKPSKENSGKGPLAGSVPTPFEQAKQKAGSSNTTETASSPGAGTSASTSPKDGDGNPLGARIGWDGHWTRDGFDYFTINVHLRTSGDKVTVPYKVVFKGPQFDNVQEGWNLDDIKISNGAVEGTVNAPWGTLVPNVGAETVIGMIYRVKSGDGKIKEITVNGKPATIS